MTTIFQRHAGAEFARFARERMVREQEARRDAETAEAFRAMVEDVSPDHMPNSLDAPCDTFQQTRNAGWAGYCAHCGWSVEFHVTQEGTDARSADATRGRIRDYYGNVLAFARDGATVTIFGGPEGRHTLPEHLFDALSTHHGWEIVQEDNGR